MKSDVNEKLIKEDLIRYKKIIISATEAANNTVNIIMLMTFYELGEDIQKKGMLFDEYVKRLSDAFPERKFTMSEGNIRNMCKFSLLITIEEICDLRLYEFGWTELVPYIIKAKDHDEFIAYIEEERKTGEA